MEKDVKVSVGSDREPFYPKGSNPSSFDPFYIVYQTRYAQFMLVSWYSNQ